MTNGTDDLGQDAAALAQGRLHAEIQRGGLPALHYPASKRRY